MNGPIKLVRVKGFSVKLKGFTIIELLVVIVTLGILAGITAVSYRGIRERGDEARRKEDFAKIIDAVKGTRAKTGTTLAGSMNELSVGLNNCSADIDFRKERVRQTNDCFRHYHNFFNELERVSGVDLSRVRDGDGKNRPYIIEMREGVNGNNCDVDKIKYFDRQNQLVDGIDIPKFYQDC